MLRKSRETIGLSVDIPATTEFEEFGFLGIDGKLLPTLLKQAVGFPGEARRLELNHLAF
jgi:hypothetical protein